MRAAILLSTNPDAPKILCIGNNPQKIQVYGAVISLYATRLIKQVNMKGKLKSSLIFDVFPAIFLNNIDGLIATARSYKVATTLGVQDASQLRKDYGKELAEVIVNITGNVISGQVSGDTAKHLSERFGKIQQDRTALSLNRSDTSISKSIQLDLATPVSKISSMSSGEFVGLVADNPDQHVDLKAFHSRILNNHQALAAESAGYKPIPAVRQINSQMIKKVFEQIKDDVRETIETEIANIKQDPALKHLLVTKKNEALGCGAHDASQSIVTTILWKRKRIEYSAELSVILLKEVIGK